jgi:UDP-N-acetylglucosamine diphosphorylase/glucosamine-1-phosphate N-acetyltransferase
MKQIAIYEDQGWPELYPLTCLRPSFGLMSGAFCLRHGAMERLGAKQSFFWGLEDRSLAFRAGGLQQNSLDQASLPLVLINGRARPGARTAGWIEKAETDTVFMSNGQIVAFKIFDKKLFEDVKNNQPTADFLTALAKRMRSFGTQDAVFGHLWEIVNHNGQAVEEDSELFKDSGAKLPKGVHLIGKRRDLKLGKGLQLLPGVAIDTTGGPVIIDNKVRITPPSYIQGPCYIGSESQIDGARIRPGTSIGHHCRISGEVEQSVIMHYSNKHHDGFLGHAYLGSWVNLGAQTCNSDLKNNYAPVKVHFKGRSLDTGSIKTGCFIGDHSKTAIGTMINTGSVVGISCNVFGGPVNGELPAFSWGNSAHFTEHKLDKMLQTAETVMKRRGRELTPEMRELLGKVFEERNLKD